ncbi:hypothetical protein [Ekhidna sp.]
MRNLIFLILLSSAFFGVSQPLNRSFENPDGSLKLLGQITLERLTEEPFGEWYEENYKDHQVDINILSTIELPDSITVFMGTWCGDSRREVPRFIKILESQNYDMHKLKIICLNTGFQNYKQAPEREERGVDIHRVPTFVFHEREGLEIGRIVEEPVISLEQDILKVLKGDDYQTAYPTANKLIKYFNESSLKELRKKKSQLINEFSEGENVYELNTYGYVLWTSFQIPKAQFVFELNTKLFPQETITHQTLARFMNSLGKEKEALACVKKGLQIEPENENLINLRERIKDKG